MDLGILKTVRLSNKIEEYFLHMEESYQQYKINYKVNYILYKTEQIQASQRTFVDGLNTFTPSPLGLYTSSSWTYVMQLFWLYTHIRFDTVHVFSV